MAAASGAEAAAAASPIVRGWRAKEAADPRLARDFETIAGLAARGDPDEITIHGARTHNLKSVDVAIPRNRFVVVTGPSGSGKSSLAFDTLYAEGQRRYVESLSSYARQFLDQLARPDVEAIEGLSPAVAIEQKGIGKSPRSTVGTITEIADYLRLLFARAGTAHCWQCGAAISQQGLEEMVDRVLGLPVGTRVQILAPVVRGRKGQYKKELDQFRRDGFARARIDGVMRDLAEDIVLARGARHDIELVVDRIVVKPEVRARLTESLGTALRLADDLALVDVAEDGGEAWWLSRSGACPTCELSFPEISPRLFSFNNPYGACATCSGLGQQPVFDRALIVPDESRSLADGAIACWDLGAARGYYRKLLEQVADHLGIELATPWRALPAAARRAILEGDPALEIRVAKLVQPFDGVLGDLARRLEDEGGRADASLARFRSERPCPDCDGARLRIEARSVRVGGRSLPELSAMSIGALAAFFDGLALPALQARIAERIQKDVRERLAFLEQVGLDYLSLDRPAATLSGGEAQRIR
ncbi:MAG: excinuclease ABC subunit UvrA, partial [Myxococcota bacterium]